MSTEAQDPRKSKWVIKSFGEYLFWLSGAKPYWTVKLWKAKRFASLTDASKEARLVRQASPYRHEVRVYRVQKKPMKGKV